MRSEGVHDGRNVLSKSMESKYVKTEKDFTRVQPAKPQKEIRKKHCLRREYPCSEKVLHVHISSTSESTKYISIKDWKIHNGSSDHDRTSKCLNITYKNVNDAEG